jgi:Gas vesicle synthesis protein GvpL/GvpF
MTEIALYAYGVLPAGLLAPVAEPILPGAAVGLVGEAGLAALISPVPRALFEPGPDCRMTDPGWVAERAAAHHAMLAAAAAQGPVLPLAFGALFSSEAPLRDWLRGRAAALQQGLAAIDGCEEWGLILTEDEASHAAWLAATDAGLRRMAAEAVAAPEGTAFLLERRRDRALAAARAAHRQQVAGAAAAMLGKAARAAEASPPQPDRIAGWSALLPRGARDELEREIRALAEALAPTGLGLRLTGPWPAYAYARGALRHAS